MPGVNQETFLGCLLGLAIGDALGMPVEGWPHERIAERYGRLDGYRAKTLADGTLVKAGEITDETETALCVVESVTVSGGVDADNIGARLLYLARGESKRWLGAATIAALDAADQTLDFQVPLDEDGPATGDVAVRGVPIGLLHAVGTFDADALRVDAETVTRLTHGSPAAIAATTAVAYGVNLAARGDVARDEWAREIGRFLQGGALEARLEAAADLMVGRVPVADALAKLGTGPTAVQSIPAAVYAAMAAPTFEDAVFAAVNAGGDTDTVGALAGALAGAHFGVSGIPQQLIDDLEARIYVSLAAPWFYRIASQRLE